MSVILVFLIVKFPLLLPALVPMAYGGLALTYVLAFMAARAGVHTVVPYALAALWYAVIFLEHVVGGH